MSNETKPVPTTRDKIRAKIFGADNPAKKESIPLTLYGEKVEVRAPTLGVVLEMREEVDRKRAMARMIVNYCFIPGTNDKVFEDGDIDAILNLPFNADMASFSNAVSRLTSIDVEGAVKN